MRRTVVYATVPAWADVPGNRVWRAGGGTAKKSAPSPAALRTAVAPAFARCTTTGPARSATRTRRTVLRRCLVEDATWTGAEGPSTRADSARCTTCGGSGLAIRSSARSAARAAWIETGTSCCRGVGIPTPRATARSPSTDWSLLSSWAGRSCPARKSTIETDTGPRTPLARASQVASASAVGRDTISSCGRTLSRRASE